MKLFANLLPCVLLCALPMMAQEKSPDAKPHQDIPAERIAPPSPGASAMELEDTGDDLRSQKNFLEAMDYYRAAMHKQESAQLHNKVGICLIQLARFGDSRKEFERAIKLDSKYAEAHNNLGVANYQQHRYPAAIKEYQKAIQLNETSAHFHSNLGSAYFSRKDFDRAAHEYQRAMELDPSIFDPHPSGGVTVKLATHGDAAYFDYMVAKMYGTRGDAEHCRLYLAKANEAGYPYVKDALKDHEFALLRKDPKFVEFVRSLKRPSTDTTE